MVDNQSVLKTGDNLNLKTGHYLISQFNRMIKCAQKKHRIMKEDIRGWWIAGHKGTVGNERIDKEAKKVVRDQKTSPSGKLPQYLQNNPLPKSTSALLQSQWKKDNERCYGTAGPLSIFLVT